MTRNSLYVCDILIVIKKTILAKGDFAKGLNLKLRVRQHICAKESTLAKEVDMTF